jgi:signal transduction histidine kinase
MALDDAENAAWWNRMWSSSPIALALLGRDRRYQAVNPVWCRMLDANEQTLCSWPYERLGHPLDLDGELDAFVRLAEGVPGVSYRRRFTTASGRELAADVHCCTGANGGLLQLAMPVQEAVSSASSPVRAWRSLSDMASALSHDALEPVRIASVHLSLMAQQPFTGRTADSLTTVTAAVHHIRCQIRGLADFAQIGPPQIAATPIALADLLAKARADRAADLPLEITCTDGALRCDAAQVARALRHLLDNAATFTQDGIPARALITVASSDGMQVLSVADQGRGIPAADLPHLFRLFATGGRGAPYGAGTGLALCRAVAEGHGGHAWIHSVLGTGTTVCLSFNP